MGNGASVQQGHRGSVMMFVQAGARSEGNVATSVDELRVIRSLQNGETHYTSNAGKLELRQGIADNLQTRYGVRYDELAVFIAAIHSCAFVQDILPSAAMPVVTPKAFVSARFASTTQVMFSTSS